MDVERTFLAFAKLSARSQQQIRNVYPQRAEFLAYEKGEITDQQFRSAVKDIFDSQVSDDEIDKCWNAMLVDLPVSKLDLLRGLKKNYTVSLISNTNGIHIDYVNTRMLPANTGFAVLDDYFHFAYYSHVVRKRKPEPEIFIQVLEENNFQPSQTIFLDDNSENIKAAASLGLQTKLVDYPNQVFEFFNEL